MTREWGNGGDFRCLCSFARGEDRGLCKGFYIHYLEYCNDSYFILILLYYIINKKKRDIACDVLRLTKGLEKSYSCG